MEKRIRALFLAQSKRGVSLTVDDLYRDIIMSGLVAGAIVVRLFYVVFFIYAKGYPLALLNGCGALAYGIARARIKKNQYKNLDSFIAVEIMLSALLATLYIGFSYYYILHYYFVLVLHMLVPAKSKHATRGIVAALALLILTGYLFTARYMAPHPLEKYGTPLSLLNIGVTFVALVLLIYLSRVVRSLLDNHMQGMVEELQDKAYIDALTGLYNRRYAEEYFRQLRGREASELNTSIAIGDLDNFKMTNDTYGHEAGDKTLQTVSAIMQDSTRKTDRVCRWGGEEFLLIIHDATPDQAYHILEKIRKRIEETPIRYKTIAFHISITFGATWLDPNNVRKSIEICDKKLYAGKRSGKNNVTI